MKRIIASMLLSLNLLTFSSNFTPVDLEEDIKCDTEMSYDIKMKQDILTIMMAYPDYIIGIEKGNEGVYFITAKDEKIIYDDMQVKNSEQKMNNADIQDILEEPYPLEMPIGLADVNSDPGRYRCYSLLNSVYGKSEYEVSSNLVGVYAPYNKYQFNKNNGAAEALEGAMKELKGLAASNGKVGELIGSINGTFNYRVISGTGKLSPHAYGIAIDIASNPSDYWKWSTREAGEKRVLYYPEELVKTFEKYNFVWGGKWGHFDTLHFEYRPEILIKAKYFSEPIGESEQWYKQVPLNENIQEYINIIEGELG
ncbi:M15 family metallopeptidase [Clostridium culturomicium]|uniref:M15 family metallopeptidase n=1 Tax=Clostridium culturomicium TaxID=1499683 RepID=UPI0009DE5E6C|nr:M15 family metallopeptidase [Clostridium culturomicium]